MPKILVIEDNEVNREALARQLERRGFNVVEAANGQEGVEQARSEKPDVIVMELNMPLLDGWQATQIIREDADIGDTPVIGMTAHAMTGEREKALQSGCTDFRVKPIEFTHLLKLIEDLIKTTNSP